MTISSVHAEACQLVQRELYRHLDEAEYLAMKTAGWDFQDAENARDVLSDLVEALRDVLAEHEANLVGRCHACGAGWPCKTVHGISQTIKGSDRAIPGLLEYAPTRVN